MALIVFRANWCPHCRMMEKAGVVRELRRLLPDLEIEVEDLSSGLTELASAFRVQTIPAFVLVDEDGEIVKRTSGSKTAAELAKWAAPAPT